MCMSEHFKQMKGNTLKTNCEQIQHIHQIHIYTNQIVIDSSSR